MKIIKIVEKETINLRDGTWTRIASVSIDWKKKVDFFYLMKTFSVLERSRATVKLKTNGSIVYFCES